MQAALCDYRRLVYAGYVQATGSMARYLRTLAEAPLGLYDKTQLLTGIRGICMARIEEKLSLDGTLRAWNIDPADEPAEPPIRAPERLF